MSTKMVDLKVFYRFFCLTPFVDIFHFFKGVFFVNMSTKMYESDLFLATSPNSEPYSRTTENTPNAKTCEQTTQNLGLTWGVLGVISMSYTSQWRSFPCEENNIEAKNAKKHISLLKVPCLQPKFPSYLSTASQHQPPPLWYLWHNSSERREFLT